MYFLSAVALQIILKVTLVTSVERKAPDRVPYFLNCLLQISLRNKPCVFSCVYFFYRKTLFSFSPDTHTLPDKNRVWYNRLHNPYRVRYSFGLSGFLINSCLPFARKSCHSIPISIAPFPFAFSVLISTPCTNLSFNVTISYLHFTILLHHLICYQDNTHNLTSNGIL